jgi:hypothetical protein
MYALGRRSANPRQRFAARRKREIVSALKFQSPGVAGPGRTSRQHLRVSRLCRVSRRPPRGAPPVARFQSHFGTFQWVAVGKSFPLVFAGGNSPVAFAASGSGICGSAKPRRQSRSLSTRSARPSLEDRDPSRLARTHQRDRQHGNHDLRLRSPPPRAARRLAKRAVVSRRRRFLDCLAMAGFPFTRGRRSRISSIWFLRKKNAVILEKKRRSSLRRF